MVHHIPAGVDLEDAAIAEPASSVIAAHENAQVALGDTVMIIGDGSYRLPAYGDCQGERSVARDHGRADASEGGGTVRT